MNGSETGWTAFVETLSLIGWIVIIAAFFRAVRYLREIRDLMERQGQRQEAGARWSAAPSHGPDGSAVREIAGIRLDDPADQR